MTQTGRPSGPTWRRFRGGVSRNGSYLVLNRTDRNRWARWVDRDGQGTRGALWSVAEGTEGARHCNCAYRSRLDDPSSARTFRGPLIGRRHPR